LPDIKYIKKKNAIVNPETHIKNLFFDFDLEYTSNPIIRGIIEPTAIKKARYRANSGSPGLIPNVVPSLRGVGAEDSMGEVKTESH